jgi:hypothetical protein
MRIRCEKKMGTRKKERKGAGGPGRGGRGSSSRGSVSFFFLRFLYVPFLSFNVVRYSALPCVTRYLFFLLRKRPGGGRGSYRAPPAD